MQGAPRDAHQTRAVTMTDPAGERTIVVIGPNLHPDADDPLPWDELADVDGVYFTGLDPRTLRAGPCGAGAGGHRPAVREPCRESACARTC